MAKKILFLYDFPLWGNGSATFMRELCYALVPYGYKIAVVAPETESFTKKVKLYSVKPFVLPVFVGHPELPDAVKYTQLTSQELRRLTSTFCRTTLRAINEFKPDIIHINHLMLIAWSGRMASALSGVRYVITCHGSDLHILEQDRRLFHLTKDAIRGSSQITIISSDTRQWFTKIFGNEFKNKLRTIPAGINLNFYPRKLKYKIINRKYKIGKKRVVLFVGRLTPQKGIQYLIKAAPDIKGEVFIIGDGPEKQKLEKLAKKLKTNNVHFLGYLGAEHIRELKEFYYAASVVVVPSIWNEPLGLVILEAMACRTPVIATRKGAMSRIVKNGVNGYLVRSKSAKDISEKVNKILGNPKLAKKMKHLARKTIQERYDWKVIARYFNSLYQRIPGPSNYPQPKSILKK